MQLDTYAKFTAQNNVERSNTFARAVCADELYDRYYGGSNHDINFIVSAATIIGPIPLAIVTLAFISMRAYVNSKHPRRTSPVVKDSMRGKVLVAVVSLGIYISIYILILDIMSANIVHTSDHEYASELSGRSPSFNLYVSYITLFFDLLACVMFLVVPMIAILINSCCGKGPEGFLRFFGKRDFSLNKVFLLFLVAPVICITTHLGYILLAWTTQPSKSTTTLILYYFLFSYLFLCFQMTYKLGCQMIKIKNLNGEENPLERPQPKEQPESIQLSDLKGQSADNSHQQNPDVEQALAIAKKSINVPVFFATLLLGIVYLGLAVIFTMVVYLMPLASEDLFSYLFNVIQFMIVVVSTQYAYKLIAGKKFSIKKVLKHAKSIFKEQYNEPPQPKPNSQKVGIVEESVDFLTVELLIPHVKKSREYIRGLENGNGSPAELQAHFSPALKV